MRNSRRSLSCLLSWLLPPTAGQTAPPWAHSFRCVERRPERPSPASPSSTYKGRQTAPRTTKDSPLPMSMPALPSGPRRFWLLLPPRCPSEYIKSPAEVQNCLPRLNKSTPPCTRVVHEYQRRAATPAVSTTRPTWPSVASMMVDSRQHKVNLRPLRADGPLRMGHFLVRIVDKGETRCGK